MESPVQIPPEKAAGTDSSSSLSEVVHLEHHQETVPRIQLMRLRRPSTGHPALRVGGDTLN